MESADTHVPFVFYTHAGIEEEAIEAALKDAGLLASDIEEAFPERVHRASAYRAESEKTICPEDNIELLISYPEGITLGQRMETMDSIREMWNKYLSKHAR